MRSDGSTFQTSARLCWLLLLLSAYSSLAIGSVFSDIFESAARVGERGAAEVAEHATIEAAALKAATKAAEASHASAATLTLSKSGQLTFTVVAGSVLSVVAVNSADDLLKAASDVVGLVVVTPDVVKSFENLLKTLVAKKTSVLRITDAYGETATLELRTRGAKESFVVVENASITYSPEAWLRRRILDQRLMQDLISRMRIIVLAPRTDQVQRLAFQSLFKARVAFASTNDELIALVNDARHSLIAIVGHVENASFVVRSPTGDRVMNVPIDVVSSAVDRRESVSLLLGCSVACEAKSTGPAMTIDAFNVADGLAKITQAQTAHEFLSVLGSAIGPLHIDTDFYGRFRVVSAANRTLPDRVATTGASFVRIILPTSFGVPALSTRFAQWVSKVAEVLLFLVYIVFAAGWLMGIVGLGRTPKRIWREIKELYAALMQRGDDEIDLLSTWETVLLFTLGPWCFVVIQFWAMLAAFIPTVMLGLIALITFPLILIANPKAYQISRELGLGLYESAAGKRSFVHGCDASLVGILGASSLCFAWWVLALPFGKEWQASNVYSTVAMCLALIGYVFAIWLTRRWPAMLVAAALTRVHLGAFPVVALKWAFRSARALVHYHRGRGRVARGRTG